MTVLSEVIAWGVIPPLGLALIYYLRRRRRHSVRVVTVVMALMIAGIVGAIGLDGRSSAESVVGTAIVFGVLGGAAMALMLAFSKFTGSDIPW